MELEEVLSKERVDEVIDDINANSEAKRIIASYLAELGRKRPGGRLSLVEESIVKARIVFDIAFRRN